MQYSEDIINFFKRHNLYEQEMFEYLQNHTDMIDYCYEEQRPFIRCSYIIDNITKIILGFRICIPFSYDDITTFISIHEIAHGIWGYKKLYKKYNNLEIELFPMKLERVFVNECGSQQLVNYLNYLDNAIDENSDEKYRFALINRDKLNDSELGNFKLIDKTTRKLVRTWKRNNR